MTWAEFKAMAEAKGIQDDDTVFELRVGPHPCSETLSVRVIHGWTGERDITIRSVPEGADLPPARKLSPAVVTILPSIGPAGKDDTASAQERPREFIPRNGRTPLRRSGQKASSAGQALDPHARSYWGL